MNIENAEDVARCPTQSGREYLLMVSIAVSLKRIADAQEKQAASMDRLEAQPSAAEQLRELMAGG